MSNPNVVIGTPVGSVVVATADNRIDMSAYLQLFPFQGTFQYTQLNNYTGNNTYTIPVAWTMEENICPHPAQGIYQKRMKSYFIERQTFIPQEKDYLTDNNSVNWTVLAFSSMPNPSPGAFKNAPWLIETCNLKLNPAIEVMIKITTPQDLRDGYGCPTTTAGVIQTGIPAAIIEMGNQEVDLMGKSGEYRQMFNVFSYLQQDYEKGSVITDAQLNKYIILNTEYTNRLDELQIIHAYQNP